MSRKLILLVGLFLLNNEGSFNVQSQRQYIIEFEFKLNFQQAEDFCVSEYGTHLATTLTLDEHKKIEDLHATLVPSSDDDIYVGLSDIALERNTNKFGWVYTSGATQTGEFWGQGEPNNVNNDEDCVILRRGRQVVAGSGVTIPWLDVSCTTTAFFACDDKPNPRYIPVINRTLNFQDAQNFCQNNFQSNLATIRSAKENAYLTRILGNRDAWVGLRNLAGVPSFTSGLQPQFTDFSAGEPNGGGDCFILQSRNTGPIGKLNDINCATLKNFACDGDLDAFGAFPTSAPTTKAPTTKAPVTSVPTTSAPVTSVPTTKAPVTSVPTTKAPVTSAPTTKAPVTSVPTTKAPVTSVPTTKAPVTPAPTLASGVDNSTVPTTDVNENPNKDESTNNNGTMIAIGGAAGAFVLLASTALFLQRRRYQRKMKNLLKNSRSGGGYDSNTLSAEFSSIENGSFGHRTLSYISQLSPKHYFHKSGATDRQNINTFKIYRNSPIGGLKQEDANHFMTSPPGLERGGNLNDPNHPKLLISPKRALPFNDV